MNLSELFMRLPAPIRRHVRKYLARTPLQYALPTGIHIEVEDRCDWAIYNDVFVCGEYDEAIESALAACPAGRPLRIVDLGANVGFFLLRSLHRARLRQRDAQIEGLVLEGSPSTFRKLVARTSRQPGLAGIQFVNRLVGQRAGHGHIDGAENSAGAQVGSGAARGERVEYLDLENALDDWQAVDLVKCDIEGSEETLIRTYPAWLGRIRQLVIEIHPMYCDSAFVKGAIHEAGLELQTEVVGPHGGQTCFFRRPTR